MRGCPRDIQPGRFDFPGAAETQAGGVNPEHAHVVVVVACHFERFATARSHTKAESFVVWGANTAAATERLMHTAARAVQSASVAARARHIARAAASHANRRVAAILARYATPEQSTHDAHFERTLARHARAAAETTYERTRAVAIPTIASHASTCHSA